MTAWPLCVRARGFPPGFGDVVLDVGWHEMRKDTLVLGEASQHGGGIPGRWEPLHATEEAVAGIDVVLVGGLTREQRFETDVGK